MKIARLLRRPHGGRHLGFELILGLALVAAGISGPGGGDGTAAAQAGSPCALLTTADVQEVATSTLFADGVATSLDAAGFSTCRYEWGVGAGRFKLDVTVREASRLFAGMGPELIKQALQGSVRAGTADEVIPDVGEAAVFKADSPVYVYSTAYLKGRILQVHLDGFDESDKKGQVIELLKLAASRL
jgi:hypothetical protein